MARLALISVAALVLWAGCGGTDGSGDDERQRAIEASADAYAEAKASGDDLSDGPCIAERLDGLDDWVVDIAHDPRETVDDDPDNQCARFRDGDAGHFVELDPDGELIRAE